MASNYVDLREIDTACQNSIGKQVAQFKVEIAYFLQGGLCPLPT